MTLRLTLAGLLALALACGGGDDASTPEPPDVTSAPPPPPPPGDKTADEPREPLVDRDELTRRMQEMKAAKAAEAGEDPAAVDAGTDAAAEEAGPQWEEKSIKFVVKVPVADKATLEEVAKMRAQKEAKAAGYDEAVNVSPGRVRCDDEWCTSGVRARARRPAPAQAAPTTAEPAPAVEGAGEAAE